VFFQDVFSNLTPRSSQFVFPFFVSAGLGYTLGFDLRGITGEELQNCFCALWGVRVGVCGWVVWGGVCCLLLKFEHMTASHLPLTDAFLFAVTIPRSSDV